MSTCPIWENGWCLLGGLEQSWEVQTLRMQTALPERGLNPQLVHRWQAASLYAALRCYKTGNKGTGNYQGFTQSCSPAMNKIFNSMTAAKQRERGFAKARSSGEMTRTLITPICDTLQKRSDERSVFIIETNACFNWENGLDESEVNLQLCGNYSSLLINISATPWLKWLSNGDEWLLSPIGHCFFLIDEPLRKAWEWGEGTPANDSPPHNGSPSTWANLWACC